MASRKQLENCWKTRRLSTEIVSDPLETPRCHVPHSNKTLFHRHIVNSPVKLLALHIRSHSNVNQSAEGVGGLGIIRGNKVGESE